MTQVSRQMLETVIRSIVDDQEAVDIQEKTDDMGVLLTLKVAQADMGKIIGRQGATAAAIRTLLRASGMKEKARVSFKIEEPEGSNYPTFHEHPTS